MRFKIKKNPPPPLEDGDFTEPPAGAKPLSKAIVPGTHYVVRKGKWVGMFTLMPDSLYSKGHKHGWDTCGRCGMTVTKCKCADLLHNSAIEWIYIRTLMDNDLGTTTSSRISREDSEVTKRGLHWYKAKETKERETFSTAEFLARRDAAKAGKVVAPPKRTIKIKRVRSEEDEMAEADARATARRRAARRAATSK